MTIERFEDLKSWQEARKLVRLVYDLTRRSPFCHDYELIKQIRAAAVSSMGNIAEGFGRFSFEDKRRFLDIAFGSCTEVQSHLYAAIDQNYISKSEFEVAYQQADIVSKLINGSLTNLDHQIAGRPSTRSRTQQKDK